MKKNSSFLQQTHFPVDELFRVIISLLPKITDYITQKNYLPHLSMVPVQTYTCYHEK